VSTTDQPLPETTAPIWRALQSACRNVDNPFRTPILSTIDTETLRPLARTVVLRQVDPDRASLIFHTDRRSPKVKQITNHPSVEWLFYDPATGIQIRAAGAATIRSNDEVSSNAWAKVPAANRPNYCAVVPPGTHLENNAAIFPHEWPPEGPSDEQTESGMANFAVVVTRVSSFDWLQLSAPVNRRLQFQYNERIEKWEKCRLAP